MIMKCINDCINEILAGKNQQLEYTETSRLVEDLGLSSLDMAELVANLELELEKDPFSNGVSITTVKAVGDLYRVYSL